MKKGGLSPSLKTGDTASYRAYQQRQKSQKKALKKRLRHFGLSEKTYEHLLNSQENCCAICLRGASNTRRLAIDHDHKTKKVRGLLCTRCNLGLGCFRDDADQLTAAIAYLDHNQNNWGWGERW